MGGSVSGGGESFGFDGVDGFDAPEVMYLEPKALKPLHARTAVLLAAWTPWGVGRT